jgi:hypothetical protein
VKIKVTIDKNGTAKVDAINGHGTSCVEKTKWVEQALGKTISQELKPEFHLENTTNIEGGVA